MTLSPFVDELRADVDAAVRVLFGGAVRWRLDGAGVAVEIERGGVTIRGRVDRETTPRAGAVVAHGMRFSVASPGRETLRDPRYRAALGGVVGMWERGPGGPLRAALEAWLPFAAVEDIHYRRLARSTQGTVGMLRVGFGCNQDCGFCWQDRTWPSPPEAMILRWVDELADAGATRLTVSGGEPTLYRGLFELLAHARARGLATHLQTNALLLRKPGYVDRLRDAGLDGVLVSFHAADPAISDEMTRAPRTWGLTVGGTEAALAGGLAVALNCVVDVRNAAHLPEHAAFIVDRFVTPFPANPARVVNYSHPSPYWDGALWEATLAPFDVVREPLGIAVLTLESAGVTVHAAGTCGFPLCVLPEGSRVAAGLDPEMADEIDVGARTYAAVCDGCGARARCPGVRRELVDRFGDRGLRPRVAYG